MRFRPVRPATTWALLAMEAAVGLVPAVLLGAPSVLVLLPLGYVLSSRPLVQRWRLQAGLLISATIWAAAAPPPPDPSLARVLVWLFSGLVPVLLGLTFWWRGGLLARSEVGAGDVRSEFVVLGGVSLVVLVLLRGLAAPPAPLLEGAALAFVVSGLIALGLARQDAAETPARGGSRALAGMSALAPTGAGLALAAVLTPAVVAAMWAAFGSVLQSLLAPLLALAQWLAGLLPRLGPPAGLNERPPRPLPLDISELQRRQQGPPEWLGWLVLGVFVALTVALVVLIIRLILAWNAARRTAAAAGESEVVTEPVGSARRDARALVAWILAWLRSLLGRAATAQGAAGRGHVAAADDDARAAYRSMLAWAREHGLRRSEAETTQQFRRRLVHLAPDAAVTVDLVTETYEWDRYGELPPTRERLAAVERGLARLRERPAEQPAAGAAVAE